MNIVISGYGRMGKKVEQIALQRNHQIITILDKDEDWSKLNESMDVHAVIDFSFPDKAVGNIMQCFEKKLPIVTGTTGWYEQLNQVAESCNNLDGTLFYAPNFSVGVNLFFKLNKDIAKLLSGFPDYRVSMVETHHIHKLDAPSGTAIRAGEDIIERYKSLDSWKNEDSTDNPVCC